MPLPIFGNIFEVLLRFSGMSSPTGIHLMGRKKKKKTQLKGVASSLTLGPAGAQLPQKGATALQPAILIQHI